MLKRSVFSALGIVALAMCWSDQSVAMLATNGIRLSNGLTLSNGLRLSNGIGISNRQELNTTAMHAFRMTLPHGTEVSFR
jgi:hypothetical protein